MLPCVSRYAVAAIRPDPAVPSRRGDHARAEILATPTQIAHRVFPGSGTKTQETPRQRHDRGTLHGRPPFLTSTLPADPRFSAPQNPARVVGSGYIQFPPQRPFAGPLLTQPPRCRCVIRDRRKEARRSRARSLSRAETPRATHAGTHTARVDRASSRCISTPRLTSARARRPPVSIFGRLTVASPPRASPSPLRIHPRTNDDSKTITPRSGKTPTSPRRPRPRAPPRSSRGTTASLPPSSTSSTTSSNTSSRRRSSSTSNTARRRRSSTSNTTASRTASPRWPAASASAQPVRRRSGAYHGGAAGGADGAGGSRPAMPRARGDGPGPKNQGAAPATRGPACPRRGSRGSPRARPPAAQKPRKMLPGAIVGALVQGPPRARRPRGGASPRP